MIMEGEFPEGHHLHAGAVRPARKRKALAKSASKTEYPTYKQLQAALDLINLALAKRMHISVERALCVTHVYIVMDDCPEFFGAKRILDIFIERKKAKEFMLRERGKNPVGGQYIDIKRMRVK